MLLKKPVWIWLTILLMVFIVKLFHLLSSVFIVIGFAGLSAFLLVDFRTSFEQHRLAVFLLSCCLFFFILLFTGAFFNGGYPINYKGCVVYLLTFIVTFFYYRKQAAKN